MQEVADSRFSDELAHWLSVESDHTVGGVVEAFGQKSFAVLFVLLLGPSALPLPTGGVTNVLELIAVLLAVQLLVGHEKVWLPKRWCAVGLAGPKRARSLERILRITRWLERGSGPHGRVVFGHRTSSVTFGGLVLVGTLGAFAAPPFSGLDTLPSLGVVMLSLGVLLEDAQIAALGVLIGGVGVGLVFLLGRAALEGLTGL